MEYQKSKVCKRSLGDAVSYLLSVRNVMIWRQVELHDFRRLHK